MEEYEIDLIFDKSDFEKIYFENGEGNYFKSPIVKPAVLPFVLSTVFPLTTWCYYLTHPKSFTPLFFGLFFFTVFLLFYINRAIELFNWKKGIKHFFKTQEQVKKNTLILTENSFTLIQDSTKTIELWKSLKTISIHDTHISIIGSQTYMLPEKSIDANDYSIILKFSEKWTR